MRQLASLTLSFLVLVSGILGVLAWLSPINPHEATFNWGVRIATAVIFPVSLVGLFFLLSRPEKVPDFLLGLGKPRMGRGAVLFVFDCAERDGWTWIDIHYQNRFAKPANVTVAFQPSQNFLLTRNDIEPVLISFACGAAAYGIIRVPIAVKIEYQGKSQLLDVASQAEYPAGTGECLRNIVGPEMSKLGFSVAESTAITLARIAISGRISEVKWQSRIKVTLPQGVAESSENIPALLQDERWTLANQAASNSAD